METSWYARALYPGFVHGSYVPAISIGSKGADLVTAICKYARASAQLALVFLLLSPRSVEGNSEPVQA